VDAGAWSWLEIAKLAASLATPIVVAILGVYIHRVTKQFEHLQWRSQKLIEKRLAVYDDLAPMLNDLLCYFTYVGAWKELDPPTVVALKRKVDKKVHLAGPLFSPRFFEACMAFQNVCFEMYAGWGIDARLRSQFARRKDVWGAKWDIGSEELFSDETADPQTVRATYREVMEAFATDLGVVPAPSVPHSGRVPRNIR
jgi:hypothetical protein